MKQSGFYQLIDGFTNRSGEVIAWMVLAIAGIASFEVIARYIFNSPTVWAHEVTALVFGIYAILAGGYCVLHQRHVRMDILWGRLSPRRKAIVDLATSGLGFIFLVLLLWVSIPYAWHSFQVREASETVFGAPFYISKIFLVIGVFLFLLQMIAKFIRDIYIVTKKVRIGE